MFSKSLFQAVSPERSNAMSDTFTTLFILSVWSFSTQSGSYPVYLLLHLWKVRDLIYFLCRAEMFPKYKASWDAFPEEKKAAFQNHFNTCAVVLFGDINCRAVGSVSSLIEIA